MSVRVIEGDCRDVLASMEPASIDLVVADPPYGETSLKWDRWQDGWMGLLRPLLKPHGSVWVFGSLRMFMEHADEFSGWQLAQDVIWEKHNGSNAFNDRFRRVHEAAAHFYPSDASWTAVYKSPLYSNDATARTVRRKHKPQHWGVIGESFYESHDGGPRLLRSVWPCRSEHGRALHPTQKPVGIIAPMLAYSCPAGGTVLDPFCGSGTTGVAAQAAGLSFIGIEARHDYAEMARKRVAGDAPLLSPRAVYNPTADFSNSYNLACSEMHQRVKGAAE